MKYTDRTEADVLNMLVEINNDRIEGYKKAIELLPLDTPVEIRSVFEDHINQSVQFNEQLIPLVFREGEMPEDGTRDTGKLFRVWMDIKSLVTATPIKTVLSSCESGEKAFSQVYEEALSQKEIFQLKITALIESQQVLQNQALNKIIYLEELYNKD